VQRDGAVIEVTRIEGELLIIDDAVGVDGDGGVLDVATLVDREDGELTAGVDER
jgi:hypothetical protein